MENLIALGATLIVETGIKEIAKSIVNSYITPKIEKSYADTEMYKKIDILEEELTNYMERSYKSCLNMNTIVFKNEQKKIWDLYIPLTVVECKSNHNNAEFCIDKYRDDFIPKYKKMLLVDTAGMGKSTIIKYLYLSTIIEKKGVPILIELRKLDKNSSIIEFIMDEINGIREEFQKEDILQLIERGDFIFFFDGYDEIVSQSKKEVTQNLKEFISKTSENLFVISSRDEPELNCFGDFQRFDIKSLSNDEAYSLIRKYDNDGELSKELIEKLKKEENLKILKEFLENPLMVSLLYKAFEYKKTVPYKKHIFYRQVYNALFDEHDLSKGAYEHPKKSKLDIEDFHRVLRTLGIITLNKGISYYKEELVQMISKAKKMVTGIEFRENDFIHDIINSVPLFVKDGIQYKWVHKSFQEYFAASYICFDAKEKQKTYLYDMTKEEKSNKYYNILDFCYDIDYKEFRNVIIHPIIEEFVKYYDNSFKNLSYKNCDYKKLDIVKNLNYVYNEIYVNIFETDKINYEEDKDPFFELEIAFKDWQFFNTNKNKCAYSIFEDPQSSDLKIAIGFAIESKKLFLLKLLNIKQSPIVKCIDLNECFIDFKMLKEFLNNKEYVLNKKIETTLNKNEISILGSFLANSHCNIKFKGNIFNYDECVKLKHIIEEEDKCQEEVFL